MTSVLWLRRDLRLHDHPALDAAARTGPVVALFVLDPRLTGPSGAPRMVFLLRTLRILDADLRRHGGELIVRTGDPVEVLPSVAAAVGAESVHVSADFNPYGARRDAAVERALGEVAFVRTGSPYAVSPPRITKSDGTPFRIYSPFYRAWLAHGVRPPARTVPGRVQWHTRVPGEPIPEDPSLPAGMELPEAGEQAARRRWRNYRATALTGYADARNRPDLDSTSRMSVYLKWGCIHPRTMLADLGPQDDVFRRELAWRDFYAMILHHYPESAREYFQPEMTSMMYADADSDAFRAWSEGRTGYPIVDAGMRQMRVQAWMHNRVRMIVASFLVKDLHIEWQHGARVFMHYLCDGDLASNQHGWQWTAGTGTDPAPFFRIFNPVSQGLKFDPEGRYVRHWVPELRGISGAAVHEPWTLPSPPADYPAPIVDHRRERLIALERYNKLKR